MTKQEKVITRLVKVGHSQERAEQMTADHFDHVMSLYPSMTAPSEIADVVSTAQMYA